MRRLFPLLVTALVALASPALAHPHIFIDAEVTLRFDDSGRLTGLHHAWTFDEAFSAWQVQGLDTDGDGTVSTPEMQELADENLVGLSSYSFYTYAGDGPEILTFAEGANASFENADGRSTLRYDVVLDKPHAIASALELAISDPDYYVAINFASPGAVHLENAPAGCAVTLEPPRELDPAVAERLYALGPDVVELPADLANAMRGVQGAIVVKCAGAVAEPETAVDAVMAVGDAKPTPFGGPPSEPGFNLPKTGLLGWLATQQKSFYAAMTEALSRLKTDNTAFFVLGGLSFLYGVFHAAGPGHGKVVISSYVMASERQLRRGILLSLAAAMLQSLVAIAFVLVAALVLKATSLAMSEAANWIGIGSYALVMLLGVWLVARKLFGWGHHHAVNDHGHHHHGHDHGAHDHDHHHHDHDHDEDMHHAVPATATGGDWREQLSVVLAVGLRPCSGALVVLVFALSQGLLLAGMAAVLLMGLGTALTVAVLASLAVFAKGMTQRAGGQGSPLAMHLLWWFELLGAVLVFAFGLLLLLASV